MRFAAESTRRRLRIWPLLIAASMTVAACGVDTGVVTLTATPTPTTDGVATEPPTTAGDTDDTDPAATTSTAPDRSDSTISTDPAVTTTPTTQPALPTIIEPEINVDIPLENVVDVDPGKPARSYDSFLAAAITDIEQWWSRVFPEVYGTEFVPLEGGIYAGYPERVSSLPGCGQPTTDPADLSQFVAFYCQLGDFIVYDDQNEEVLAPLAREYGPAVMGIVMAHEYAHAIQGRIGALDRRLPTIVTEQQADCFAGAWTGQAYDGASDLLRLGDADVRAGLIAMLSVRDPVGTNQFVPGGHGSAFDRVGAFQDGFVNGPGRCADFLDDELNLVPNQFQPNSLDQILGGNAPYDCEELRDIGGTDDDVANCTPAPVFLADDLNDFWQTALGEFAPIGVEPQGDLGAFECSDPVTLADEVVFCTSTRVVAYDEPAVLELYREFGDFTLGYFYGIAWAEAAQQAIGSDLAGEPRALLSDCLTGAWVRDITPDAGGSTPRQGDRDGDGVPDGISSSPGDLDEAIRMAILEGDDGANEDFLGTAFEKIAALRVGVLGGLGDCQDDVGF